jgi:D-Tyr-tRNAtyr deacylase
MPLGIVCDDDRAAADRLAEKVCVPRVFEDAEGRMNEALGEREILCVSQFTEAALGAGINLSTTRGHSTVDQPSKHRASRADRY